MKFICPLVVVEDIKKSRKFYEELLGQKVKADFGENITFLGDFAIHQKSHYQQLINDLPIKQKSNNFELYFEDDELITLFKKLKQNNIEFLHEIREQPWRQQVMRFYDYDGHIIEVGERMGHVAFRLSKEGLTVEEISKITFLPIEIVSKSIESKKNT